MKLLDWKFSIDLRILIDRSYSQVWHVRKRRFADKRLGSVAFKYRSHAPGNSTRQFDRGLGFETASYIFIGPFSLTSFSSLPGFSFVSPRFWPNETKPRCIHTILQYRMVTRETRNKTVFAMKRFDSADITRITCSRWKPKYPWLAFFFRRSWITSRFRKCRESESSIEYSNIPGNSEARLGQSFLGQWFHLW